MDINRLQELRTGDVVLSKSISIPNGLRIERYLPETVIATRGDTEGVWNGVEFFIRKRGEVLYRAETLDTLRADVNAIVAIVDDLVRANGNVNGAAR